LGFSQISPHLLLSLNTSQTIAIFDNKKLLDDDGGRSLITDVAVEKSKIW